MTSILSEIESPSSSLYGVEQKKDLLYDAKQAQGMVLECKAHILRQRVKTKQNKTSALNGMFGFKNIQQSSINVRSKTN